MHSISRCYYVNLWDRFNCLLSHLSHSLYDAEFGFGVIDELSDKFPTSCQLLLTTFLHAQVFSSNGSNCVRRIELCIRLINFWNNVFIDDIIQTQLIDMEDLLIQISKDAANAKLTTLSQSATEAYGSVLR